MLSVIYAECHKSSHYAECRYAEYRYADGLGAIRSFITLGPGACSIKLFTAVIYGVNVFILGKPFQPSLMFVGEARSLPYL